MDKIHWNVLSNSMVSISSDKLNSISVSIIILSICSKFSAEPRRKKNTSVRKVTTIESNRSKESSFKRIANRFKCHINVDYEINDRFVEWLTNSLPD